MLTEKVIQKINSRFFKDFYGLSADQLTELGKHCEAYKIQFA